MKFIETPLTPQNIKGENVDAILFFSPSGVESYLKDNKIKNEICFCIGETTASALENKTKNIIIAEQPTIEDVIEVIIRSNINKICALAALIAKTIMIKNDLFLRA